MIKEALRYIVELGRPKEYSFGGISYTTENLRPVYYPVQTALETRSLSSVVEYIKNNIDGCNNDEFERKIIVHIESPERVTVKSEVDYMGQRKPYMEAVADFPHIDFNYYHSAEAFNVLLQSSFIKNDDTEILLKVVGNLKDEAVKNISDDGVSQAVTIKTGVATVGDVKVPNPVTLRPYRTFIEVQQPESKFIFRMKDGGKCALFEADGGAWRNVAVANIKDYLSFELAEEIENDIVKILA